jgi:adenylyltransferase/sulfurtransferase
MYLAAAGIGRLIIADGDRVDLSNLQRQLLHGTIDIGRTKVQSARETLTHINPMVRVECIPEHLEGPRLDGCIRSADIVLDASDNFTTRFSINRVCVHEKKPLVSAAAIRFEGQVAVFDSRNPNSPCYNCLYHDHEQEEERCVDNGILAPVAGVIGSLQALEAIKVLLNIGDNLCGRLLIFDGLHTEWRELQLKKDPACPVCNSKP